ncbi:hypothetical protein EYF80_051682 [Xyrichtys novacula]|uniref:G-protein coupled receptors family 1 profile domain-containing protein n=1 Tax=Xyrichtys novacula TaxID=13765 RepID=A0AAV1EHN5_XYRNO|nr:hypothetical protein EYF80_051682 [Xyrichtys novacula]
MNTNILGNSSFCPDVSSEIHSRTFLQVILVCYCSRANIYNLCALSAAYILHLPPFVFVLYLGIKQRRGPSSTSTAASHSDLFTYHCMAMQLTEILGLAIILVGRVSGAPVVMSVGIYIWVVTIPGKTLFNLLTCLERYMAVVHPIIYLGVTQACRVRIAHISIIYAWVFSFVCLALAFRVGYNSGSSLYLISLSSLVIVVSYCSVSALCVLKRPGPGEVGGNNERSKQKAFFTIMAITGVLLLRFGGHLIVQAIYSADTVPDVCALLISIFWLDMPSTLLLIIIVDLRDMSTNSFFNSLPLHPQGATNHSIYAFQCLTYRTSLYAISAFAIAQVLLLPFFILVLYLSFQRQCSVSTNATSHSDLFTYHSVAMQLNDFLGFMVFYVGMANNVPEMVLTGLNLMQIPYLGKAMFHVLTCLERYLAVVHPITYLRLKSPRGVTIRNTVIGCVWLISFGWLVVVNHCSTDLFFCLNIFILVFFLFVMSFCCIMILWTLKNPGPGTVRRNKERVDKSKQRAFYTVIAIMGVLLVRFGGNLAASIILDSNLNFDKCNMSLGLGLWLELPSTLVLPLLFLHRIGKLQCCTYNTESG